MTNEVRKLNLQTKFSKHKASKNQDTLLNISTPTRPSTPLPISSPPLFTPIPPPSNLNRSPRHQPPRHRNHRRNNLRIAPLLTPTTRALHRHRTRRRPTTRTARRHIHRRRAHHLALRMRATAARRAARHLRRCNRERVAARRDCDDILVRHYTLRREDGSPARRGGVECCCGGFGAVVWREWLAVVGCGGEKGRGGVLTLQEAPSVFYIASLLDLSSSIACVLQRDESLQSRLCPS